MAQKRNRPWILGEDGKWYVKNRDGSLGPCPTVAELFKGRIPGQLRRILAVPVKPAPSDFLDWVNGRRSDYTPTPDELHSLQCYFTEERERRRAIVRLSTHEAAALMVLRDFHPQALRPGALYKEMGVEERTGRRALVTLESKSMIDRTKGKVALTPIGLTLARTLP